MICCVYVGVSINNREEEECDVDKRFVKRNTCARELNNLIISKLISTSTKKEFAKHC